MKAQIWMTALAATIVGGMCLGCAGDSDEEVGQGEGMMTGTPSSAKENPNDSLARAIYEAYRSETSGRHFKPLERQPCFPGPDGTKWFVWEMVWKDQPDAVIQAGNLLDAHGFPAQLLVGEGPADSAGRSTLTFQLFLRDFCGDAKHAVTFLRCQGVVANEGPTEQQCGL